MKKYIAGIFCMSLLSGCAGTNLYALSDTYNTDTEIIETEISENAVETEISVDTAENIQIDKEYVANHMLNAVDYYTDAEGSYISNMEINDVITVSFAVHVNDSEDNDYAYEKVKGDYVDLEAFSSDNTIKRYYHDEALKEYCNVGLVNDEDLGKLPFAERIGKGSDGIDIYYHRNNKMHLAYSHECLMSQELAFGLLKDFSLWDIEGETEYLGYPVITVKGTTEGKYGGKLGMQSFMLYIEKSTGILMNLEGYDSAGNLTKYTRMQDIAINKGLSKGKETILKELEEKCGDYEVLR